MIIGQIYEKKGNLLYLCVNFMTECFNNISESGFSALLDVLLAGKSPGREGWRLLLAGLDDGQDESLRALAAEAARKRFGYSFADSLKSLRGVATTVIIAGFAVPTVSPRATVCLRSKYSIVAGRGHGSASGLLSCRAEKMGNKMRIG